MRCHDDASGCRNGLRAGWTTAIGSIPSALNARQRMHARMAWLHPIKPPDSVQVIAAGLPCSVWCRLAVRNSSDPLSGALVRRPSRHEPAHQERVPHLYRSKSLPLPVHRTRFFTFWIALLLHTPSPLFYLRQSPHPTPHRRRTSPPIAHLPPPHRHLDS